MFCVAQCDKEEGTGTMEETLAQALVARIDGRRQSMIAERMGISQNRLSEILKGARVEVGKSAVGILTVYPDLWPFFFSRDFVQAMCDALKRNDEGCQT